MVHAIDARRMRTLQKWRARFVRALIVVLAFALGAVLYQRYERIKLYNALNEVVDQFVSTYNSSRMVDFHRRYAHSELKRMQDEKLFEKALINVNHELGNIDGARLATYTPPSPEKRFHIMIYEVTFQGKHKGALSIALDLEGLNFKLYAWKITSTRLKK